MNITVTIGYDDHTSTYMICEHIAQRVLQMDDADNINDYIVNSGHIVKDDYDAQQADAFLNIADPNSVIDLHIDLDVVLTL